MFFGLTRPRPRFKIGHWVERESEYHQNCRYMVITMRRFARLRSEGKKQWVYDGFIVTVRAEASDKPAKLRIVSDIRSVLEKNLKRIPGLPESYYT